MEGPVIRCYASATELFDEVSIAIVELAKRCIELRNRFDLVLSGGSTPQGLFERLAHPDRAEQIDWKRVYVFWSDERVVPPTSPESNYGMAHRALLSQVSVPAANVHRVPTELPTPNGSANAYDAAIRQELSVPANAMPEFDLVLLGVGEDGHTASLFQGAAALDEMSRIATSVRAAKLPHNRITLTLPAINAARAVWFVVTGSRKADIVQKVVESDDQSDYPARRIAPKAGTLVWQLDVEAATKLDRNRSLFLRDCR